MRIRKKAAIWGVCILLILLIAVLLFPRSGFLELPFYVWADYVGNRLAIPRSGIYMCEELQVAISFDDTTRLLFSDGTSVMLAIDQGGNVFQLCEGEPVIKGNYTAYLNDGYIALYFEEAPLPIEIGQNYSFFVQVE